jgi:hypothetical protein
MYSHEVLIMFLSSFQHAPQARNVFPNMLPIAPHFISYSLPRSSTLVTYRDYEQINERNHNISIFGTIQSLILSYFVMGQSKTLITKEKELNFGGHHNILI